MLRGYTQLPVLSLGFSGQSKTTMQGHVSLAWVALNARKSLSPRQISRKIKQKNSEN
jgi:hypothetical protein